MGTFVREKNINENLFLIPQTTLSIKYGFVKVLHPSFLTLSRHGLPNELKVLLRVTTHSYLPLSISLFNSILLHKLSFILYQRLF